MDNVKIHRNIVRINDINIFYFDTQTKGEVILCLHGRWGRAETWADFIQHYGTKYRIIAPDQRGHGWSDKPISSYAADEMAADLMPSGSPEHHFGRSGWVIPWAPYHRHAGSRKYPQ